MKSPTMRTTTKQAKVMTGLHLRDDKLRRLVPLRAE